MGPHKAAPKRPAPVAKPDKEADDKLNKEADDKLNKDSGIKVPRLVRGRRDRDGRVQRAIEMHFSHFPRFLVENKVINGRSLRDRIASDMDTLDGSSSRLGSRYWIALRAEYGASLDPCAALAVKDTNEKVSDVLITALTHFTSVNPAARTGDPLCSFLSQQVGIRD